MLSFFQQNQSRGILMNALYFQMNDHHIGKKKKTYAYTYALNRNKEVQDETVLENINIKISKEKAILDK